MMGRRSLATRAAGKDEKRMKVALDIAGKRLLNREEMVAYIGMGRTAGRAWCEKIGAIRHIGGRTLFDKWVIDAAIDSQGTANE